MHLRLWLFTLVVALCAFCTHARGSCAVPFNRSLVGRVFSECNSCGRPDKCRYVRAESKVIKYLPFWTFRFVFVDPSVPACREKFVFHFRRRDKLPFVRHFIPFPATKFPRDSPTAFSTDELKKKCPRLQVTRVYKPWGRTRRLFIRSIRRMVKEIGGIRDFKCEKIYRDFFKKPNEPPNEPSDIIVNYLISVGYSNFFCAQ